MTGRDLFIAEIEKFIEAVPDALPVEAIQFFNDWKGKAPESKAVAITENGMKILKFMQENQDKFNNIFKARDIGEGLFMSGRSVSGSMKKMVTDGFVEKTGKDPVTYSLTEKGEGWFLTI